MERLQPYLDNKRGDLGQALRLYTWNIQAASAFWGPLHVFEVALRNAFHSQLAARFGQADWWDSPNIHFTHVGAAMVAQAKTSASRVAAVKGRPLQTGDVVAALSYGFWSSLAGPGGGCQYETQFWQPALIKAFPNNQVVGTRRAAMSRNLESVRLFRNRIANHEPIFRRHLAADHDTLIRLADAIDHDLADYMSSHSRVVDVLAQRNGLVTTGIGAKF